MHLLRGCLQFCPKVARVHIPFSVVFERALVLGCAVEWVGAGGWGSGGLGVWLQESRWLCWYLGPGLPPWGTSPGPVCPRCWSRQSWSTPTRKWTVVSSCAEPVHPRLRAHCFRVPVHLVHGSQQPAYTLYTWKTGSTTWPCSHPRHPSVSAVRPDLCCYPVRSCSKGWGGLGVCPFRLGSTASPPPLAHVSLHADVRKPALGHFSPVV